MSTQKPSKADSFFKILKNIFFALIILQFMPIIFSNFKTAAEDALYPKAHVGLLKLTGEITDPSFYVKKLEEFSKDRDIKALLLHINSPGGYPGPSQAIFNEVKKFREKKPVVVLVENVCASGAYYVAAGANSIIATPSALMGSIGVFMGVPNVKHLMEFWKVYYTYIQSGAYKTSGSMVKDISAEEKKYFQAISDDAYQQFIYDVAVQRKLSTKDVTTWADGKIFTGNQALKLKLIDKVGTYHDALAEIRKLAKIKEEIKLMQPKRMSGLLRLFTGDDDLGTEPECMASSVAKFASTVYNKFLMYQAEQTNPTLR